MSVFSEIFEASGVPTLQSTHGDSITYTVSGAETATSITAIIHSEREEQKQTSKGVESITVMEVGILLSEIAAPAIEDEISYNGSTWYLVDILSTTASYCTALFVKRGTERITPRDNSILR